MDSSNSTKGRCISDSECWDYELNLTKKIYNEILEQKVLLLEPGLEISDFLTKQKALGHDGLRLRGDWCPAYQKIIIMFWVTHRKLYSGIIGDHSLQHILETEIVQTHLIETVQKIPHNIGKLQGVYMNWAYSTIKSQSEFILNYIKSIDNQFNSHYFMMKQFKLMPYGLKLARPRIFSNDIKIFQFWSSYVDVFLKMEKLGETPSLETAIGLLVKQEFEETSKIMEKFLIYVDGMEFSPENPVLAQFLYYLAENTSHNEQKELSIGALTEFKKNSPMTHSM
ncbi:hypothetical protein DFH28DRAFT_1084133 [Melampsora americana]|nr:hypothetical protein DFH28DRAFT_1084133 [Melampsora americana]